MKRRRRLFAILGGFFVLMMACCAITAIFPADDEVSEGTVTAAATQASTACRAYGDGVDLHDGPGSSYPVVGTLNEENGLLVAGATQAKDWYVVYLEGNQVWVASSAITTAGDCANLPVLQGPPTATIPPSATPLPTEQPATATPTEVPPTETAVPSQTPTPVPTQPVVPTQVPTPQPTRVWNCNGDLYNCDSFDSCADLRSYFNACPGDPSQLDRQNDGRPCEDRCGG